MAIKLGSAYVSVDADTNPLARAFERARGQATAFGGVLQGVLQGLGQRLFDGIIRGVRMVIDKMGEAVQASSNLNEAINKTGVVFGSAAEEMVKWSETASTSFGLSQRAALDAASQFGALFRQMGEGPGTAAALSQNLVQIASDLSSIYNIPVPQALEKIQAGLIGEIRPLRDVNIFLTDNVVKQKAVTLGLAENTNAVSDAAKVQARYALIVEGAAIAQGDFGRTSKFLANAQRILTGQIEDGAARLGGSFRPAVESITNLLIGIAPQMFGYAQNITDQFAAGLASGIRAIIPVITQIRQLFSYWFKPGSPPKILPDIDKWGQGTLQAWLDGMASVDVKAAFDTVGKAVEGVLRSFVGAGKMDEGGLVGTIFGSRDAIAAAVSEFRRLGSVSESTIQKIADKAGPAGAAIAKLTSSYFDLQRASEKVKTAQDALNRTTEQYDRIISPLRDSLDQINKQQQALANQQRKIAANNTINNFEATAAEKAAAALELQQIALEDQIAVEEERRDAAIESGEAAVETATKEEEAAQQALDAAQATIDRQVETNNLLGEQKRLVEQLAAAQEAAASAAQAKAEQASSAATAAAEKAQRESEQLAAAQLRYNLELADTPGQIALMEAELAKLTPGTVEYFDTLTRINQLQQQYKNELESAAKAASAMGAGATEAGGMIEAGLGTPMGEASAAATDLSTAIDEMAKAFSTPIMGDVPAELGRVADALDGLLTAIENIGIATGLLPEKTAPSLTEAGGYWATFAGAVEGDTGKATAAQQKMVAESKLKWDIMAADIRTFTGLLSGDWKLFWEGLNTGRKLNQDLYELQTNGWLGRSREAFGLYFSDMSKAWGAWLTTTATSIGTTFTGIGTALGTWFTTNLTAIGTWFTSVVTAFTTGGTSTIGGFLTSIGTKWIEVTTWLGAKTTQFGTWTTGLITAVTTAGGKVMTGLLDGMKSGWGTVETWFSGKLKWLTDQLPFSEPKDPSSPLRGLGKSGESIIGMVQGGMERAALSVEPLATSLLPQGGATTNNNNSMPISQIFNFYGQTEPEAVRKAAESGTRSLLGAMRASGVTI